MPSEEWSLGTPRQPKSMPKANHSYPEIKENGTTYIEMNEISLFYVQVLEIVISAPQPRDVRTKSRRLFMKAEHSIYVIFPLAFR